MSTFCVFCGVKFNENGVCPKCGNTITEQEKMKKHTETAQAENCPSCNVQFNENGICPRCGFSKKNLHRSTQNDKKQRENKSFRFAVLIILILLIIGLIIITLLSGSCDSIIADGCDTTAFFSEDQNIENNTTNTGSYYIPETTTTNITDNTAAAKYQVGDIITLGKFEQDGELNDGGEDIEWMVLDVENDRALILSVYALSIQPYNTDRNTSHTWETCSLRAWLNNDFYNTSFTQDEKDQLLLSKITNGDNPDYGTDGGNDTYDTIFILSVEEAQKYLSESQLAAKPTWYNRIKDAPDGIPFDDACWWWLRTVGENGKKAVYVDTVGYIGTEGNWINIRTSVRPAAYISIT